ncbi:MAG: LysR substrate-binding domain-containing protein [Pseudomonadota bacterium]
MPVPLVRLFSLDLLKSFVAVGRRMNITQAADDLCLTQSAVSRQVNALEDQLGVRLFVRQPRGVGFTEQGRQFFRVCDHALQQFQDLAAELKPDGERAVTITASMGVAGLWLLPRLGRLQERYPSLDLRVATTNKLSDLRGDGIDLAVRYCRDAAAPSGAIRLFDETVAPVAHPSLLSKLESGAQLPLLDFDDVHPWLQWRRWLDQDAWAAAQDRGVLQFNQYDQVIYAALAGQGVALGRLELIAPLLRSGQLTVVPLDVSPVPSPHSYWLLQAEDTPRAEVERVARWIVDEAKQG